MNINVLGLHNSIGRGKSHKAETKTVEAIDYEAAAKQFVENLRKKKVFTKDEVLLARFCFMSGGLHHHLCADGVLLSNLGRYSEQVGKASQLGGQLGLFGSKP